MISHGCLEEKRLKCIGWQLPINTLVIKQGAVAQLAEYRIVYPMVAGSSPVGLAKNPAGARGAVAVTPLVVRVYVNQKNFGCFLIFTGFRLTNVPIYIIMGAS